jgi:hypothetical protein
MVGLAILRYLSIITFIKILVMKFLDFIVKRGSGKNTILDKEYSKLINEVIVRMDEETEERWETYNLIIKELFNIDDGEYFQEIKYRLTDGEDVNKVLLDIISRYASDELTVLVYFLSKRVEEYEEDFLKRFYN